VACSLHLFGENNPKKAALAIVSHFPTPGTFEVRVCTQCGDCAAACPVDAIHQNEKGAYYVEPEGCTLCMACVDACPEGVVFTRPDVDYVWECDLCGECVEVCGPGVLWIAD
jgi:ferredoxin